MPALFDVAPLLTPLDGDAPCGPELDSGDPDFQALELASAGKPERQYGDKVYPAEPPDWAQVFDLSLSLLQRSRDLRYAVWLVRSGARLMGLPGAARGLQLVHGLLEQQWALVHPQLDATDNDDPTMRMNALTALGLPEAALADLRAAGFSSRRGSLTLRELELGLGKAEPYGDELRPTEAGVLQALADLHQSDPNMAEATRECVAAADAVIALLEVKVGSAAPNLAPLRKLLAMAGSAVERAAGGASDAATDGDGAADATAAAPAGGGGGGGGGGAGAIRSRADAVRELERICDWFERHEPGHPAPLLMRRAQRLMNMSFIEIIQDMAPDGFSQVQNIAGPQPE